MRNGWQFPLVGLQAKWELFSKTGKTASSVVMLKSGELTMDLKPNEQRQFETALVEFKGTESGSTGFTGNKYYGYRISFYYRNTLVKVVAVPEPLCNWGSE
jgi:hypothetical protein